MFTYEYLDGIITVKREDEIAAQQFLHPQTQEPITDENAEEVIKIMRDIYENDPAFIPLPEPDQDAALLQERELLYQQLDAINLREISKNQVNGNITEMSPVTALFIDVDPVLSERDSIIARIQEIDGLLSNLKEQADEH